MLSIPVLHYLLQFAQAHVHWVSDTIQPSHPLSPSSLAVNLSQHQGLFHWCWSWSSNTLSNWYFSHQYWSFHLSTSLSNEYSGLISFRIDWFDLLAVQWTLKSLLQHHSSKTSILWGPIFIMVQLSHPHMTLRKIIVLTIQTFVDKVMSLL